MSLAGERSRPGRAGWSRHASPVLTLIALVVLTGCNGDDDPVVAPTTTTRVATTTTTATTPGQDPVAAELATRYKQFWEVRFEANREPVNPDNPKFGEFATGPQLEQVVTETRQRRDQGLAIRRPEPSVYERRVKVVSVEGETASLQDCVTNDGIVYRVGTGEVIDSSVVTRNLAVTMRRVDGMWKLAETRILQEWEGVAGCAKSSGS